MRTNFIYFKGQTFYADLNLILKMKRAFLIALIFVYTFSATAQVGISTTSITPDASSILELRSNNSGFLPPRMTRTERDAISSPATGLIIYNTTTNRLNYYNGNEWQILGPVVSPGISATGTSQGVATDLINGLNIINTVTDIDYGVKLPAAVPGYSVYVVNAGTNTLLVYPAPGGSIDALGANNSYDIQPGGAMEFKPSTITQWYSTSNVVKGKVTLTNTVASTTANIYADITGLSFQATAGILYQFKATIIYSSGATNNGSGWSVNGPGTPTLIGFKSNFPLTATTEAGYAANGYNLPATSSSSSAYTTGNIAVIQGFVNVVTSGTIVMRFRSETNSGIIVQPGSVLEWW
jgi:hypothetical protein